jgi:small subunit ribosomal protein S8
MSHDNVADTLNQMMNALKAGKTQVIIKHHSKLLLGVLALAQLKKYIKHYELKDTELIIFFDKLNGCKAIKPRTVVKATDLNRYALRYLPAKELGIVVVSTPAGLMTHHTAQEKRKGGCLLAYFY